MNRPLRPLIALAALGLSFSCGETISPDAPDSGTQRTDAALAAGLDAHPLDDAGFPEDAAAAAVDASAEGDAAEPGADASVPSPDAATAGLDAAAGGDAAPGLDAAAAGLDAASGLDASLAPYEVPAYAPAADDTAAFQALLEAASIGAQANSEIVAAAAGDFCGGAEKELVLFKTLHSFVSVLRGPTPHAVASGDLDSATASPWRAAAVADFDGDGKDEVMAFRHVTLAGLDDVVLVDFDASCKPSKLAGAVVGGVSNSNWVSASAGDVDGDGQPEAVGLKPEHSNFVVLGYSGGQITLERGFDQGDATHPWAALAVGDLDGDQKIEIAAARRSSDSGATVFVYRLSGATVAQVAQSSVGASGSSSWAGAAIGDFNGDGRRALALVRSESPQFLLLETNGSTTLATAGQAGLDSDAAQPWSGLVATDWLGGDSAADELIALRQPTGAFDVGVLVYGSDWHDLRRRQAIAHTRGQYDNKSAFFDPVASPKVAKLQQWMSDTHTNTYNMMLWDETGKDYLDLVEVLEGTRDFAVDGRKVRLWVTLIPRTESAAHDAGFGLKCSVPADSPLTAWDEKTLFDPSLGNGGCLDFRGWGKALGRLAAQYPQLVAVNIDDFTHNVGWSSIEIHPDTIAAMTAEMRSQAPWLALAPTFYYREGGAFVLDSWPDVGLALDSILFYFRNEKQGVGPCASAACGVPAPAKCTGACLAGTCAEATVANAPGEIADMAQGLPGARRLQFGVYASSHSTCGQPSAAYVENLLETVLTDPLVEGASVYVFQHPSGACSSPTTDRGCAVQKEYGAH
ncbi:MAG TPA: VCBS repeat-containing protein [Myxococcales bacterium]|jgi:hypothetical protein